MKPLLRSLAFYREDWFRILCALGLLALATVAAVIKPWPLAWMVDGLAGGARDIGWAAAALFGAHLLHALLHSALQTVVISTGLLGLQRVRRAVYGKLLGMSVRRLQGTRAGDLIFRATWDTYAFQTLFTQGVFGFLAAAAGVATMSAVMWRQNVALTLVALATAPPLLLVMRWLGPRLTRRADAAQRADSGIAAAVQQLVANLLLVQSFTREADESGRFADGAGLSFRERWRQHRLEVVYLLLVAAVLAAGTAGIVAVGAREVAAGRLSTGGLLVFLAYLAQLYEPLSQISHLGGTVANARAGAARVLELLGEPPPADGDEAMPAAASGVELAFHDVCFSYEGSRRVLDGVSFTARPGETVALIGPSGAGKTTLLQMATRFLDPDSGTVSWNGTDIRRFRLPDLRRAVGLVLQEPLLLPATVAENIGYGREGASREEIEVAARAANAHGFIRALPRGYDTVIGDGAARLSVGEKQRLNLARAFLKDAPVLLLDEPTSALDRESEAAVLAALRSPTRRRTTLVVAHRLETIRHADRVVVFEAGRIVECGSPAELRAAGGYFARLTRTGPEAG